MLCSSIWIGMPIFLYNVKFDVSCYFYQGELHTAIKSVWNSTLIFTILFRGSSLFLSKKLPVLWERGRISWYVEYLQKLWKLRHEFIQHLIFRHLLWFLRFLLPPRHSLPKWTIITWSSYPSIFTGVNWSMLYWANALFFKK